MIHFKQVSYKNFLSTGNQPNVILLDRVPSAIITGQNGAGKSTILDAITFGLYGKPYRNINKPQLVNTVNEKNCVVEIEFEVNQIPYKIVRGLKPGIFEIWQSGRLMNHDAAAKDYQAKLEEIIGLNYKAFTQIVILGSARYQSFMDLSTNDRRVIIEEILDITVFSKMNAVLKTRQQNVELEIRDNDYQKEIIQTKISAQKSLIKNLMNRSKESEDKVEEERAKVHAQIQLVEDNINKVDDEISKIEPIDVDALKTKLVEAKSKGKEVQTKVADLEKQIQFYETADTCHSCHQTITDETKEKQITSLSSEKEKLDKVKPLLFEAFQSLTTKISDGQLVVEKISELQHKRTTFVSEKKAMTTLLNSLVVTTKESDNDSLEEAKALGASFVDEKLKCEKQHMTLVEKRHNLEICKILLKDDGIKSKIIKQYLPVMNQLINKYLDKMGANYSFNLDEQFNEIIKSRYRDTFSYASFSEGEKQRIDLALMLTWREVAKLKNSVNTNLLILDEIGDSSMDGEGTDILWEIIEQMENSNVFVISHKTSNIDKFSSHIEFVKDGNFSKILHSKK
jgi:DNA repair exonuclease SbcCD ATPase subunit